MDLLVGGGKGTYASSSSEDVSLKSESVMSRMGALIGALGGDGDPGRGGDTGGD
jgi:hypothetical protein